MRSVAITGSARGFGFALAKDFIKAGFNVILIDVNEENLTKAKEELETLNKEAKVLLYRGDVTVLSSIEPIIEDAARQLGSIDIWINNAGVNQAMCPVWELDEKTVTRLIEIDLKGTILCSKAIMSYFVKQGHGQIYNVEGFGSNDAYQVGLSVYGTAKRGVTYFTEALAYEVKEKKLKIQVGKITPGIMITNFINHNLGEGQAFELSPKVKKVYNILGDYPETIASFMVKKIVKNKKNDVKFVWLSNARAFRRFLRAKHYMKRDFFHEHEGEKETAKP